MILIQRTSSGELNREDSRVKSVADCLIALKLGYHHDWQFDNGARVIELHDHKGWLTVYWNKKPSFDDQRLIGALWEMAGEPNSNVSHYLLEPVHVSGDADMSPPF